MARHRYQGLLLNTPLTDYEYIRIPVDILPPEIITAYDLADKIIDGYTDGD
jgi:hypothetical protein